MLRSATDLIAGKTIDVGDVKVCNDATTLTVTYETTCPWCLLDDRPARRDQRRAEHPTEQARAHPQPGAVRLRRRVDCLGRHGHLRDPLAEIGGRGEPRRHRGHRRPRRGRGTASAQEGAWGEGTRFVERGTWAMYFTYEVQAGASDCLAAGGVEVGGACWFAGAVEGSCAAACAAVGGAYDVATRDYAGSGAEASLANCLSVLQPLGLATDITADVPCTLGLGCVRGRFALRCATPETSPDAFDAGLRRACACMP